MRERRPAKTVVVSGWSFWPIVGLPWAIGVFEIARALLKVLGA